MKLPSYTPSVVRLSVVAVSVGLSAAWAQTPSDSDYDTRKSSPSAVDGRTSTSTPSSAQAGASSSAPLKGTDRSFLEKAAALGAEEVAVSQVAADRAVRPEVKALAAQMVTEHSAANAELAQLAQRKGVTLPARDATVERKKQKEWSEKKAKAFDHDYLDTMENAHEDAIEVFEKGTKSEDPDVASYAAKYLPVLRKHHEHIKSLAKTVD